MTRRNSLKMSSQSRHVYTRQERAILEASYARQSHPNIQEKERLAQILNCNLIQISNWFQNHRVCALTNFFFLLFIIAFFLLQRRMKKLNQTAVSNNSPVYPTSYFQYQSTYSNDPSYFYYSCPMNQCVYSQDALFFDE